LALVAAGLALAVILTHNYHRHLLAGQVSGCSISEYVDCDRVSESPYAAVAGVPISALAIAAYGALGVLLALPLLAPFRRLAGLNLDVAVILAAAGTLVALALAVVAALVIRALCIYCALLQVVTVALFLVLAWRWRQNRVRSGSRRQLRGVGQGVGSAVLALAVGAVLAGIATLSFESSALAAADRAVTAAALAEVSPYLSRDAFSFDTTDSPGVGPADAPVQIVVFGDYNCSHCRQFDPEALQLAEDFAGDVRVVFKFFPLDATCNGYMQQHQVSSSCLAAAAAYAAHRHDHFLDYHLLLFEHFQNHARPRLMANAEEAGITDQEAFVAAIRSEATLRFIQRDIEEGARGGVRGTPAIFVNGRRLETSRLPEGTTRYQVLVHEIRALLRAAL
jgi:protein-disulfide isomerase/uncharacterized membrane protein